MLFNKGRTTITEHLRNIFKEGELTEKEVCWNFRHTTMHCALKGKTQTKVVTTTINMYGSIKGIAGTAIGSVKALELPEGEESIE